MSIVSEKKCSQCGGYKSTDQFAKDKRHSDGLESSCKKCKSRRNRAWQLLHGRAYYLEHKDRINENADRYEKTARAREKNRRNVRKYRQTERGREKQKQYNREYRQRHPEKRRESSLRWQRNNKDLVSKRNREYIKRNPEIRIQIKRNYRARKKDSGGKITVKQWNDMKTFYDYTCLCCKRREPEIKLELDHIIPLSMHGSNVIENAQPLCKSCNSRKRDKCIDYR